MADLAFSNVPESILVPLWYAEIYPGFTPIEATLRVLLIGHRNDDTFDPGTGADETPYIMSRSNAHSLFGAGSMLAAMYRAARKQAPFLELWGVAAVPTSGGTQAVGTIVVTATPTKNDEISIRIGGEPVRVLVKATDTKASLGARIRDTINKNLLLPVKATFAVDTVTLTVRWAGSSGNDVNIVASDYGVYNKPVADLLTITNPTGGAGSPGLSPCLAAIGDQPFDVFAVGFRAVAGLLDTMSTFLDGISGRWSPSKQLYGHAIFALFGDLTAQTTFGNLRNDPHISVMGVNGSPSPSWMWAAAIAAIIGEHFASPPEISRPEQTLELVGILPPARPINWFDQEERQALLEYGMATYTVDPDRTVRLERLCTLYKTDTAGFPDASWRDAVTLFQAAYFVRYMRNAITGAFPRAALTEQDTGIPGFASPGTIKDVVVHNYSHLVDVGLVENLELFAAYLVVQINSQNPTRVDCLMRIDVVNQLRILAALVETDLRLDPIQPDNLA
jgi:phage tail sheath gpL-like